MLDQHFLEFLQSFSSFCSCSQERTGCGSFQKAQPSHTLIFFFLERMKNNQNCHVSTEQRASAWAPSGYERKERKLSEGGEEGWALAWLILP